MKIFMYDKNLNTPEVFLNKDFIGVWDNVIKDDFCNFIIKTLNESTQIVPRSNTSVKDTQLDIAAFNPMVSAHIMCAVRMCLEEYIEWYPFLKNFNYHSTTCLLQKLNQQRDIMIGTLNQIILLVRIEL